MVKLSENPPISTPNASSLTEFTGTWWIAHTKARFEKAFARDMLRSGIDYFLPMREKISFSGRRKRQVLMPLFNSYVFICGTEMDRYAAMTTNRLCQTIPVVDQEGLVRQLSAIERALLTRSHIDLYPHLPVGSRGRIASGPMKGAEGVVVDSKDGKSRVVLEITILGQGAVVEIDADMLEPIDELKNVE